MHDTLPLLQKTRFPPLRRKPLETLQVNLGYLCNQSCLHCHVNAGPHRTEMMDELTLDLIPKILQARGITTLDLTGGAPELHSGFKRLVRAARAQGVRVIDRCNLTVLFEPGQEDLSDFLAEQGVDVVASMPCYSAVNVDKQRGDGVFASSVRVLKHMNTLGFGVADSGLELNLVYNPGGPFLPGAQDKLESDYKARLLQEHDIVFNKLYTLANMPIKRFGSWLQAKGEFEPYMKLLRDNHQERNLDNVMCRDLISVDYRGYVYDCDFNQMLGLALGQPEAANDAMLPSQTHLRDLLHSNFNGRPIRVAGHCFGCTAGQGSSCGGALV